MGTSTRKSIIIYTDILQHLQMLSLEESGSVLVGILNYANTGEVPKLTAAAGMCFSFLRAQIDRDTEKWERTREMRVEAGRIGGIASGESRSTPKQNEANEASASKLKQIEANEAVNVTVTVPVNAPVSVSGNKEIRNSADKPHKSETDFDSFWKEYPRKTAKTDARKAFDILMKSKDAPTIERLVQSVTDHKRSKDWTKDGGQFIPHPATFIRKGMYDDEAPDVLAPPLENQTTNPFLKILLREREEENEKARRSGIVIDYEGSLSDSVQGDG